MKSCKRCRSTAALMMNVLRAGKEAVYECGYLKRMPLVSIVAAKVIRHAGQTCEARRTYKSRQPRLIARVASVKVLHRRPLLEVVCPHGTNRSVCNGLPRCCMCIYIWHTGRIPIIRFEAISHIRYRQRGAVLISSGAIWNRM